MLRNDMKNQILSNYIWFDLSKRMICSYWLWCAACEGWRKN